MALVPSSVEPAFPQQGALDWVALSNISFSASLAILGRLSGAGLEPLTVAIAQAISSKLPIGIHGERRLDEAMKSFRYSGSFGQVVWFGVGVRHVLQTLVQTSQGSSSVALAAALSEGFTNHVAASVLYELSKCHGSPSELTPSFAQWERYAQVCSGIFKTSGLGHKITQLARNLGFVDRKNPAHWRASDPKDIAKFLYKVSDILTGNMCAMTVTGGATCTWALAFCDYILGLRVQLLKVSADTSEVIFQNYDSAVHQYQISFVVPSNPTGSELAQASGTYSLLPAEQKLIHRQQHSHYSRNSLDWSISQDAVLRDYFGLDTLKKFHGISEDFSELLGVFTVLYHVSPRSRFHRRYASATDLLYHLSGSLPETETWVSVAQESIEFIFESWAVQHGETWETSLQNNLNSSQSGARGEEEQAFVDSSFGGLYNEILQRISIRAGTDIADDCCTVLLLTGILCDVVLDDPLELRRFGLGRIFAAIQAYRETRHQFALYDSDFISGLPSARLLKQCLWLYTGDSISNDDNLGPSLAPYRADMSNLWDHSAASSGGIYCFMGYLMEPFQSHSTACKVHVGRGSIEFKDRLAPTILDRDAGEKNPYSASISSSFPRRMKAEAIVEDSMVLRLWFEQWDEDGGDQRQAVVLGEALQAGWYGSKGFWRGPCGTLEDPDNLDQQRRVQWMSSYGPLETGERPLTLIQRHRSH